MSLIRAGGTYTEVNTVGFVTVFAECVACGKIITPNIEHCPSLVVKGVREPLCEECFHVWNEIHRTRKGLEPIKLHPKAYSCSELE